MEFLAIEEIIANPYQPRKHFAPDELHELAKSIKEYGIIEPLVVRINRDNKFELIAGERRLRAAKLAGLAEVPVILTDYSDKQTAELALIENVQRSDLNAIEEAIAYKTLVEKFSLTQEFIAQKMGKSRSYIANFIRLLNLAKPVQNLVLHNKLSMGQAKPLLAINDEQTQIKLAELIAEKNLSARKVEALVKKTLNGENVLAKMEATREQAVYLAHAQEELKQVLGTKVNIKQGKKKSCIEIEFYSDDDLQRLIEVLTAKQYAIKAMKKKSQNILDFKV